MPIYGRYEPAEAMRDLGISLAHAVTGMAQTELESRKMDLALKESDLKLGLLEKESQVNTLKAQLEGEVRKTSLAQKAEEMGMHKTAQEEVARHNIAVEKNQAADTALRAREVGMKEAEVKYQKEEVPWREALEKSSPHLISLFKMAGYDLEKKASRKDIGVFLETVGKLHPAEAMNWGLYGMKDSQAPLHKELLGLQPAVEQGDQKAIERTNEIHGKLNEQMKAAESALLFLGKSDITDFAKFVDKEYPELQGDEKTAKAAQLLKMSLEIKGNLIDTPGKVKDVFYAAGLDKDTFDYQSKTKKFVDEFMKVPVEKRDALIKEAETDGQNLVTKNVLTPGQNAKLQKAIRDEIEKRVIKKATKPPAEKKVEITTEQERPPVEGERYSPVATTAKGLWEALSTPAQKRPGWNERRFQEWVGR
jgi:hypothetical protein